MTYKTRCNGNCVERIDRQAETIRKLRDENLKKTQSLVQASEQIEQLEAEKADLTQALNKVSQAYNLRADQNWDGGFRAEVSE
ncbi:hypothetical protein [Salinicoccus albus]|uniref:hypothetical protein n=1 Tax=Salinicoccus albus TaxID=418756 RepID=UPI000381EBA9|nr:hypothetical protein [Salinicoccus albus]